MKTKLMNSVAAVGLLFGGATVATTVSSTSAQAADLTL
jgi:hypothetical protein